MSVTGIVGVNSKPGDQSGLESLLPTPGECVGCRQRPDTVHKKAVVSCRSIEVSTAVGLSPVYI